MAEVAQFSHFDKLKLAGLLAPVVLIWGGNFAFIQTGVSDVGPFMLGAMRFAIASLPFVFFVARPRVPFGFLIAYSATFGFAQFGCLFAGISLGLPSGVASILVQLQAVFGPLFAFLLLGQRLSKLSVLAVLSCLFGLGFLLTGETALQLGIIPLFLGVLAAVFWGLSNTIVAVAVARGFTCEPLALVVWSSLLLPLPFLAASYTMGEFENLISLTSLATALPAALYLGLMATIVAYHLWIAALATFSIAVVSPFSLLVPFIALTVGYLVFGETVSCYEIMGCILIILGVSIHLASMRSQHQTLNPIH